jgi:hypothetical protein
VVGEKVGERAVAGLVTSPGGEGLVTHATGVKQRAHHQRRQRRKKICKGLAEIKFRRNYGEIFLKMVPRYRYFCALLKKPKTAFLLASMT